MTTLTMESAGMPRSTSRQSPRCSSYVMDGFHGRGYWPTLTTPLEGRMSEDREKMMALKVVLIAARDQSLDADALCKAVVGSILIDIVYDI